MNLKEVSENIVGKVDNTGNHHFPTFCTLSRTNFKFSVTFILSSASAFNLDWSKILLFHKGLRKLELFPKRQIVDNSKMTEFADNNFKFDENGRKFFKRVENTVRTGEIAHSKQFLLFP